jgi:exonuclease III
VRRNDLKFWPMYDRIYKDSDLNDDPYFGVNIHCKFHNIDSLADSVKTPIFLSINVQSLLSKFDQLLEFITILSNLNVQIDVIAVQEIWEVKYKELVILPGFQPLVCKTRSDMRGGGVGFYVRENLCFSVIEDLSPFTSKIFESITIKLTYPASKKSMLLTCAYRSNGTIYNLSQAQQMESFFDMFSDLVFRLQQTNSESYIFMDANINLLEINGTVPQSYMNLMFAGVICKALLKQQEFKTQALP